MLTTKRARLRLEQLEERLAPALAPTATEQLFLERLNDARANPAAYGASIGLDLSTVAASMPLAFDPRLVQAARQHSQDMVARNFFAHTNPDGADPGARLAAAGYPATAWGESIAAGYAAPDAALSALIIDAGVPSLGHRRHLLAIDASFRSHREIGVGFASGGTYGSYYTIDSGRTTDNRPYLTGVIYNDANRSGRYDVGEGQAGVRVEAYVGSTLAGATDAFDTGGYSLQLSPGTYNVRVLRGGAVVAQTTVTLASDNVRFSQDLTGTVVTPPTGGPPPTDGPPVGRGVIRPGSYAVGSDAGVGSQVRVVDAQTRQETASATPFGGFAGGSRVALGDVNRDGFPDLIVGAGPGAPGGHVVIYSGRDLSLMASFFSYPGFLGGVTVASGDVNGDGYDDVVTGAGPGAPGGHLKVIDGRTLGELASFYAYPGFVGGINVAVGDVNGDGNGDVITGAGPGAAGGHLKIINGRDFSELLSIFAYEGHVGGVTVSAGDLDGDGFAEVITGAASIAAHVKIFDGQTRQERGSFLAYPGAPVGVRVAVVSGDLVTAPTGLAAHVKRFAGESLALLDSYFAGVSVAQGGLFLAGG